MIFKCQIIKKKYVCYIPDFKDRCWCSTKCQVSVLKYLFKLIVTEKWFPWGFGTLSHGSTNQTIHGEFPYNSESVTSGLMYH